MSQGGCKTQVMQVMYIIYILGETDKQGYSADSPSLIIRARFLQTYDNVKSMSTQTARAQQMSLFLDEEHVGRKECAWLWGRHHPEAAGAGRSGWWCGS